jgi:general stress protein YciG
MADTRAASILPVTLAATERNGPEFYEKIGKKGGSSTATKYGPEFFGRIGKKGGKAVTAKYGAGHFERIGRKGGQKVADLIERAKAMDAEKPAPVAREVEELPVEEEAGR